MHFFVVGCPLEVRGHGTSEPLVATVLCIICRLVSVIYIACQVVIAVSCSVISVCRSMSRLVIHTYHKMSEYVDKSLLITCLYLHTLCLKL